MKTRTQFGFSLVELIAVTAILLVVVGVTIESGTAMGRDLKDGIADVALESRANRVIDRIAEELMRAGVDSVSPADPNGGGVLSYRWSTGYEDGERRWGSPSRIQFDAASGQIFWIRNAGLAGAQTKTWATGVARLAEGESINSADDNDNGLIDEGGLAFDREGDVIMIHLTLTALDPSGRTISHTASRTVRLRN